MKKKIAVTTTSFAEYDKTPLRLLKENNFEIIANNFRRKLDKKETLEICSGCVGIIAGTETYDQDILRRLGAVKVISRCGAGMENIDMESANELGIKIHNTPDVPTRAVAELTVGLILNLLRKVNQADVMIKNGKWQKLTGNLLHSKRVGIIGFGRIGRKVAELLSVFGVELAYCDIEPKPCLINCPRKEFKEIFSWADIITLHLSISKEQCPIIGEKELNLMRRGSWLINISRGYIIEEKALYRALKNDKLSGAALDVFEQEPYIGELRELDNAILTPHIGSYARETRLKMEIEAAENLIAGLNINKGEKDR